MPEDVPAEIFQRFITAEFAAPDSPLGVVGKRHGLAAVLPAVERMVRDDLASKVNHPMRPKDVPAALVDSAVEVFEDQAHENCGEDEGCPGNTRPYHEALIREALAGLLPEYEQMVRERIAKDIEAAEREMTEADPATAEDSRRIAQWSGGLLAAVRIARGGAR